MELMEVLKYNDEGLIPTIIQDFEGGEVLMLAYMNKESLKRTLETKSTWFWSRSRRELWNKGATSGNLQQVKAIHYDCDADTLLIKVKQQGNACHTGERSCFYNEVYKEGEEYRDNLLLQLYEVIKNRKQMPKEGSYTNYLFEKGLDKILKKVGEEAAEVIIAAKNPDPKELVYESADLLYHLLVLLNQREIEFQMVIEELRGRVKP